MKTRSILRRLGLPFLSVATLLAVSSPASAQNVSNWTGNGGNNLWSNAANWDTPPTPGPDTFINFTGGNFLSNNQDISNPFQISGIGMDPTVTGNVTVNGFGLAFVAPSSPPATITTAGAAGSLILNVPLNFTAAPQVTWQIGSSATDNPNKAPLVINGSITSAGTTISTASGYAGAIAVINSANNLGFAGTLSVGTNQLIQLGGVNSVWRTTAVTTAATSGFTTGTTTAAGNGLSDAAYNQQVGSVAGLGQFLVGTTDSPATALVGYSNGNTTVGGTLNGVNVGSQFAKVGTGILTVNGANASANLGLSVRDGQFVLGTANGSLVNSLPGSGATTLYGGSILRLNSTTAPALSVAEQTTKVTGATGPPFATSPAFQAGRLSNTASMRVAGGLLRYDGNATANNTLDVNSAAGTNNNDARFNTEVLGSLVPWAGYSNVALNPNAAQLLTMNFAGVTEAALARGGMVNFTGAGLGGAAAGNSNITFGSNPSVSNGLIPWATSQTTYVSAPTATALTLAPDTFAILGPNGVAPLTTFSDGNFSASTVNSRVTAPTVIAGGNSNSVMFETAGVLTNNGTLNVASGAMFSRTPTGAINGTGSVVTAGRFYISGNAGGALNIGSGTTLTGTGLSKGGNATSSLTLNGPLNLGTNPLISANAGTLTIGTANFVGAVAPVFQVARGATLSNVPALVGADAANLATLRGNGTVAGPVTLGNFSLIGGSALGGDLSTGASPGTMSLTGPVTMNSGARWRFYISSAQNGTGTGAGVNNSYTQGLLSGTSTIDFGGAGVGSIAVQPHTLSLSNGGNAALYDMDQSGFTAYSWLIGTFTGGVLNFNSNKFSVDLTNYTGTTGNGFSVTNTGNNIFLNFVPLPEPMLLGLVPLALFALRRRKA